MFDVVEQTPKDIFMIYVIFMSACLVTYPIIRLIVNAAEKGLKKWR